MDREIILNYIKNAKENSHVDFKKEFYKSLKQSDLPKDISAFANYVTGEDKYIIFGIEDENREVTGIDKDEFSAQDNVDDYLAKTIEPFPEVLCGIEELDNGKSVGYIKILANNKDVPYVIKNTCGKNNSIQKGDIYIRKGTCNMRATRSDLDEMYIKRGKVWINVRENFVLIAPIPVENDLVNKVIYGQVTVEIYNDTTSPILIDGGNVNIVTDDLSMTRSICSTMSLENIREHPIELTTQSRKVYTMLFNFSSQDCVDIGFDERGYLGKPSTIQVELYDTDDNIYKSNEMDVFMIAKGDILHKVKRKYYDENKENLSLKEMFSFWLTKE